MTNKQYLAALKRLGLTPAGKATASSLGLSLRQCQRIAAGANVPATLARLLAMYQRHGIPDEWRGGPEQLSGTKTGSI